MREASGIDLSKTMACPHCDALHVVPKLETGDVARCKNCHAVLMQHKKAAIDRSLAAAIGGIILLMVAPFTPFLGLSAAGLSNEATILEAVVVFDQGYTEPLVVMMASFIILLPLLRFFMHVFVLLPLRLGWSTNRYHRLIFRYSETMRPWAMAEIFVVGVAVALVKIGDLATISIGPAFWAMVAVVLVVILDEIFSCRWTVWEMLDSAPQG